jgi:protein-L-isoaspartate(D-aspartate) O-methyltransferase
MKGKAGLIEALSRRVRDPRVLAAIADVPRDLFVPPRLRRQAWRDRALPIGEGQTISQPFVVARMCELLELRGDEHVLDVGTGSGYHAAVLARLARDVVSIERHFALTQRARAALEAAGVANVTLICGDGAKGHPPAAPYDAINVGAGSAYDVRRELAGQLGEGGRMVIPSDAHGERLVVVRRRDGGFEEHEHEFVRFVPLIPGG